MGVVVTLVFEGKNEETTELASTAEEGATLLW